jgi:hypothetical protein
MLLQVAAQLTSASAELFAGRSPVCCCGFAQTDGRDRYLAWAFETRDGDAERWLRSNQEERQKFFTPAKLRAAAHGTFRGKGYGYHCELVEISGVAIEGATLDFVIQIFLRPTFPDVKVDQWFDLGFRIDRFTVSPAGVSVFIGK